MDAGFLPDVDPNLERSQSEQGQALEALTRDQVHPIAGLEELQHQLLGTAGGAHLAVLVRYACLWIVHYYGAAAVEP